MQTQNVEAGKIIKTQYGKVGKALAEGDCVPDIEGYFFVTEDDILFTLPPNTPVEVFDSFEEADQVTISFTRAELAFMVVLIGNLDTGDEKLLQQCYDKLKDAE